MKPEDNLIQDYKYKYDFNFNLKEIKIKYDNNINHKLISSHNNYNNNNIITKVKTPIPIPESGMNRDWFISMLLHCGIPDDYRKCGFCGNPAVKSAITYYDGCAKVSLESCCEKHCSRISSTFEGRHIQMISMEELDALVVMAS